MNEWSPQKIVALGFIVILLISVIGHEVNRNLHPAENTSVEWWGRILLTVVGGLLLYLGTTSQKKE
jgi:hypothetical protein